MRGIAKLLQLIFDFFQRHYPEPFKNYLFINTTNLFICAIWDQSISGPLIKILY